MLIGREFEVSQSHFVSR